MALRLVDINNNQLESLPEAMLAGPGPVPAERIEQPVFHSREWNIRRSKH